ncbi:MAG: DUF2911 domain-containing protein [Patiriisocius sp.]
MKNLKSTILFCAFALMTSQLTFSQEFKKLDKSPMDVASFPTSYKISDKTVKVTYSRPKLKGRELSKLAPTGEVWRTGANEAAQITFYKPMMAGKTLIKPGTYSLFTIPGQKEWTVIINSEINLWGAYYYNQKYDVATMQATITKGETEAFSIAFTEADNGIEMHLGWGSVIATTTFTKAVKQKAAPAKKTKLLKQ